MENIVQLGLLGKCHDILSMSCVGDGGVKCSVLALGLGLGRLDDLSLEVMEQSC